jgi:transcription elongation factor Elf1
MPLSGTLRTIDLTFECPICGHAFVNTGNWFMTVGRFTCEGCGGDIRLTYHDKLALFEKHAHLA